MNRSIILLIITIILFSSCNAEQELTNTYIGSYRIWDQKIPYPYILNTNDKTIQYFNHKGSLIGEIDRNNHTINTGDTLYFKDYTLCISGSKKQKLSIKDLKDTQKFPVNKDGTSTFFYTAIFKQLFTSSNVQKDKISSQLIEHIWTLEKKHETPNKDLDIKNTLHFTSENAYQLITYSYKGKEVFSEFELLKYYLFEINNLTFISFDGGINNPLPIYQITKTKGNQIIWKNFRTRETEEEKLTISKMKKSEYLNKISTSIPYSNCFDGLIAEYYYEDITYIHGNEYLKNNIKVNAPQPTLAQDGYITVHYNVNCNREIGRIGLEQMDRNYNPIEFDKHLVSHIIKEVTKLKEWPLSYGNYRGTDYSDVHGFLMFKIKDGSIIDVSP